MLNFFSQRSGSAKDDMLSGLTVALALVPEAIAFAFVAGVSPVIGLYSAFFIGLVSALLGGRPGMISGATGAMAVVVVALVAQHDRQAAPGRVARYAATIDAAADNGEVISRHRNPP